MADAIDWEASQGGQSVLLKPRKLSRAELSQKAWEKVEEEIRTETGIPFVSKAYFDSRNEFVIRLRGTSDRTVRMEWGEYRVISKGVMPNLWKDFVFKGEGKSPYALGPEMEKWVNAIIKWARSLDGKAEMEAANRQAQTKAPAAGV